MTEKLCLIYKEKNFPLFSLGGALPGFVTKNPEKPSTLGNNSLISLFSTEKNREDLQPQLSEQGPPRGSSTLD